MECCITQSLDVQRPAPRRRGMGKSTCSEGTVAVRPVDELGRLLRRKSAC
jgi:hypothetical protein